MIDGFQQEASLRWSVDVWSTGFLTEAELYLVTVQPPNCPHPISLSIVQHVHTKRCMKHRKKENKIRHSSRGIFKFSTTMNF